MTFKKIDHDDNQRPEGRTCILVYGYDPIALSKIREYAKALNGIETVEVKKDQTYNTLSQLIDQTGNVSKQQENHEEPAVILNAVSSSELNQFVHNFRSLGLKSPLFAMVTETSINWRFHDLIDDLLEERAMFLKMKQEQQQS